MNDPGVAHRMRKSIPTRMAIAIVSYNTVDVLRNCLESFTQQTDFPVIVVDNGSTDGSIDMVRARFPDVDLVVAPRNNGYGAAANLALEHANAEYLLLLNSDTLLHAGRIVDLPAYMDSHPQVAVVGPRLLNVDRSLQCSYYSWPTPAHLFLQESGLLRVAVQVPWMRWLGKYDLQAVRLDSISAVPWMLGAALVLRTSAVASIGGFDERYFMYYEEVDLSWRLAERGWERHFVPTVALVHCGGTSTRQHASEMALEWRRGVSRFYRSHFSAPQSLAIQIVLAVVVLMRIGRESLRWMMGSTSSRARSSERINMWVAMLGMRP